MNVVYPPEFFRDKLQNYRFPESRQHYTAKDCILYALGIGFGSPAMDTGELSFVYEEPELKVVPSMASVLAGPGFWARDPASGIDWRRFLHAEQEVILHRPLPAEAFVTARTEIKRIIDKGAGKGALIYLERVLRDEHGDLATVRIVNFARGNGGCGGDTGPQPEPHQVPARPADAALETEIDPRAALIYRLSGDPNPLHVDPDVARSAGFPRPILHGLCSFGLATRAVLKRYCACEPSRMRSIGVRFSNAVYPGERLCVEMWRDGSIVSFRAIVPERDVVALDHGYVEIA
ncbi:MAG: MaoC/PaaZ C-terminal domain-containing protein [Pseudomonadota bacterium]